MLNKELHNPSLGRSGMVAAAHPLAAESGRNMITEYGGNAIDAAIATAFALGVVDPGNSGIGGYGGMAVIYLAKKNKVKVVDFNTKLPLQAISSNFIQSGKKRRQGYKAIAVPGTVAGLQKMYDSFGSLQWKDLINPAIELAREGFIINKTLEEMFQEPHIKSYPNTISEFFDKNKQPLKSGDHHSRPDYAKSLEEIAIYGSEYFYNGELGEKIVKNIQDNGGYLTLKDLKDYKAKLKDPTTINYKGYDIFGPPDNSGAFTMMQTLKILEGIDLTKNKNRSSSMINAVSRAMGLAWKDRKKTKRNNESVVEILKEENIQNLIGLVEEKGPYSSEPLEDIGHTTHLSTADSMGNTVALTLTHGPLWFGSGVTIPQTGIVMNNGMVLFSSDDSHAEALTNLTPTIVLKDEKPILSIGTPGATKIMTIVTNFLIDILDYKLPVNEAILKPRFHFEGDYLYIEKLPKSVQKDLEEMGYRIKFLERRDFYGPLTGIKLTNKDKFTYFEGVFDPRYEGGIS